MKLNIEILCENLSEVMEIKQYGHCYKEMNLSRPIFYDGISKFETNNVYLVSSNLLPEHPSLKNGTVIVYIGSENEIPKEYFNDRCSLIILNSSATMYKILNTFQKIYDKYDEWDYRLQKVVREQGGLKILLETSTDILKNPIAIIDKDFNILACTSAFEEDKELKNSIDLNSSRAILNDYYVYRDAFVNGRQNKNAIICEINNHVDMVLNIFRRNEHVGALILRGNYVRPLLEGDKLLLQHLKKYVDESLEQYHNILNWKSNVMEDVISSLLEGKIIRGNQFKELKLNENRKDRYICLKCKLENDDIVVPIKYASIQANKFFPDSISLVHENVFLVFIKTNKINNKVLQSNIKEYLTLMGYKGGVSNEFSSILDVREYFLQACSSIEIGSKYDKNSRVYYFEDYTQEYIISMATKEISADKICSKELLRLADYDAVHDTDYFNELRIYLENNMNAVHTAKKLFMHRNTFLIHLENINKIIDLDLENPDERFYIEMSYKLLKSDRFLNKIKYIN